MKLACCSHEWRVLFTSMRLIGSIGTDIVSKFSNSYIMSRVSRIIAVGRPRRTTGVNICQ